LAGFVNTFGATREKLLQNSYAPCSALRPAIRGYLAADDVGGVLLYPQHGDMQGYQARRLCVLVITTRDRELRKKILALLVKHELAGGPVRVASDGSEARPLRYDGYDPLLGRDSQSLKGETEPAVILECATRELTGGPLCSGVLRVDGEWTNGSLLTVPRSKLPEIDSDGIDAFFTALNSSDFFPIEPWRNPPPPPSQPRKIPAARRRDLLGNQNVMVAHQLAVEAGEAVWLPDAD
jgi:hypothetical protein